MALPTFALPTESIDIDGQIITLRGLSRGEAMKMAASGGDVGDVAEMEIQFLSHSLDTAADDVRAWYHNTPSPIVQRIVGKAMELSGLDGLGNA